VPSRASKEILQSIVRKSKGKKSPAGSVGQKGDGSSVSQFSGGENNKGGVGRRTLENGSNYEIKKKQK